MVLATAQFLVVLSTSIVNVALPSIRAGLRLSPAGMSWVVNAYVLAFGALLLLGGRAADVLGRRRVFLAGLGVFTTAALVAGLAPSAPVLVAARAVQGFGAAALAPAALSLVVALYPTGRALAVWGAVSGAGGAAGVLLGGVLTSAFGWPSVFIAVVPVGVVVGVATLAAVPADTGSGAKGVDVPGALTVTAGLSALVWALSGGGPWLFGAAVVLLTAFVVVEHRTANPLVPLRLFTTGGVGAASVGMTVVGAVWVGLFFFLPLYQQQVLGFTPLAAGLTQLPLSLSNIAAAALAPRLAAGVGGRAGLAGALAVLATGLAWLGRARVDGTFTADVLGPSLLIGAGLGTAFVLLTAAAVDGVPAPDLGLAGGLTNATRQVGGAVGLAVLSAVAAARTGGATDPASLANGYRAAFLTAAALITILIPFSLYKGQSR
ncbi:MFS transporter [Umezawaea endophytica]|uniref:MFS transporter n=1 Tax=Umezawaea endophytica TaxID=1654476 RepID=A0A9X3A2P7_9PSEU|nr:MFS transporter [Umezawaea endophytica]MCS7479308.1 MFS transporter [Umezawaea endophytica]